MPGITATGTVPDVRPYLWRSRVSIVPLRIAGGTRLKVYEAAAAGVPIVSTSVGAEGLDMSHGKHLLLADSAPAFAESVVKVLDDSTLGNALTASAFEFVESNCSWPAVAAEFEQALFEAAELRKRRL
jgi:glycosyltransferase involved in cell wall biosynthesis